MERIGKIQKGRNKVKGVWAPENQEESFAHATLRFSISIRLE